MSRPVVTDKWAGNYDCSICRRKRLVGSEFSKKSLDKYRKSNGTHPLKCKKCVAETESKERGLAASKREASAGSSSLKNNNGSDADVPVTCGSCKKKLLPSFYNKNQLSKGEGKGRCRSCVEDSIANEAKSLKDAKEDKIARAKEKVRLAEKRGNVAATVKAEAELAALEAEIVTGLKPVVLGRGKKGYSRGGGRGGRGRGTRK
jgi:hypothetical protein